MTHLARFDLVSLRLFLAVVDAGSLTAGADRFGISLAAASKRIAELEQRCGVLLQRRRRGVTTTALGQTVRRHAVEVVARLEQLALTVDDLRAGASGHLRLWANPSAFGGFLPRVLAAYMTAHPQVCIDLEDSLSEDAVRAVQKGVAEVAVIGDNVPCENLETFVCNVEELVLLVPDRHVLANFDRVSLEEALEHEFITLARSASLTRVAIAASDVAGRPLRTRVQVRSFDSMCRMVACGVGLAMLPRTAAELYVGSLGLRLVQLQGFETQRRLLVAMRRRTALTPAAAALVEMLERGVEADAADANSEGG